MDSRGVADALGELDAEQLGFLPQPAGADAEEEPPAAEVVEGGNLLGQQDGVAFGDEADAGAELEVGGNRRSPPQRDKWVDALVVHLRDDAVRGAGPGRFGPGWNGRVLGNPEGFKTVGFAGLRQLGNVDGGLGDKHCDADIHG